MRQVAAPCDRVRGEPTQLIRTLGVDPGAESVVSPHPRTLRCVGSIERLVRQCGSRFVGGGGTRCRISRPCAKTARAGEDRRGRAANQGAEVPLGKSVARCCAGVWALGSDSCVLMVVILGMVQCQSEREAGTDVIRTMHRSCRF